MINSIIRFFGLKGSWKWAVKQIKKGEIVRPSSATGTGKYKLDHENQGRICWNFSKVLTSYDKWESANIFLKDFDRTDWKLFKNPD